MTAPRPGAPHMLRVLLFVAAIGLSPASGAAQDAAGGALNPDRDQPLEITADQTLEWHRDTSQYIARGNVLVRQGNVTIAADTLTADYRETPAAAFEIYRLTADGNVRIESQGSIATGRKATYDVDRGVAVMTGDNLTLTSPDQVVTARESFEYWVTEGKLVGRGDAKVRRREDTLEADIVTALFTEDAGGKRQLKSLSAEGNVRIVTPDETLTGARGDYTAASNIAALSGDVKIARGPNLLEGERAEVNLTTNISRMIGNSVGKGDGGRVRGIFYPGSTGDGANPLPTPNPATQAAP